jgi:hypothetical protein
MATRSTGCGRPRQLPRGLLALALVLAGPGRAIADGRIVLIRAEQLFDEGNAAMARDDATTAAECYRAAWNLAPQPRIVLNLGIALAELGRIAEAAEAFTIYLADPASDPTKRPVLEDHLRSWRSRLGEVTLQITPPDDAEIEIDGARPLRGRSGETVPIAPGEHRVTVRAIGYHPSELRLTVAPGQQVTALLHLIRDTPRVVHTPEPERPETRPWKWVALGVGVAAAATGTYFGLVARDTWGTVDDRCPDGRCTSPADLAIAADARRAGTRANIAFGATGAAAIAAVVLWRLEPRRRTSLSIAPHASGGWLCISGPF